MLYHLNSIYICKTFSILLNYTSTLSSLNKHQKLPSMKQRSCQVWTEVCPVRAKQSGQYLRDHEEALLCRLRYCFVIICILALHKTWLSPSLLGPSSKHLAYLNRRLEEIIKSFYRSVSKAVRTKEGCGNFLATAESHRHSWFKEQS